MLTVQNDWIEYEAEPVQARRVAVRGGAACAQRGPVGTQGVLTQAVLAPVARPDHRPDHRPARAVRPVPAAARREAARLRLTRRGRVVLIVLPSLLLLSGALLAAAPGVAEAAQPAAAGAHTVVVGAGDSLWTIAERIAPDADPRTTVAAIERANHLRDDRVQAGEVLVLPVGR